MGYMEDRERRYENNQDALMKIALELKSKGFKVYTTRSDRYKTYFKVVKDGKYTSFGFAEVPYRWYWGRKKCGLLEDSYKCPITCEEIIEGMREPHDEEGLDCFFLDEI